MKLSYEIVNDLSVKYGDSFYLLDSKQFQVNYEKMLCAFKQYYEDTVIAYSYKTNYIPKLCAIINQNGGYAEVVSEMEMWLALEIGVAPEKIYYNGPYKKRKFVERLLLAGGKVNIDSLDELKVVVDIANDNRNNMLKVGLRCNVDIGQEESSRFGINLDCGDLGKALDIIKDVSNIKMCGLHCHLPFRNLETFKKRMNYVKHVLEVTRIDELDYISLGGGYLGEVDNSLAKQFQYIPPTFDDYAKVVAGEMSSVVKNMRKIPQLIIEPGSALVANVMKYVVKVISIKKVRDKRIATVTGSSYNINPSVKGLKRPIEVINKSAETPIQKIDIAGYTCIEGDYLYKEYEGGIAKDDYVVFHNVGSYSIVMKPPFILPDVSIIEINDKNESIEIGRKQDEKAVFCRFVKE